MNLLIAFLIRLYPAAWRREFGPEFVDLLRRYPLGPTAIANIVVGALGQHATEICRRLTGDREMANQTFSARYDLLTKIVSAAVFLLLVGIPLLAMNSGLTAVIAALASAAVIGLSFAWSPRGYEIAGGALRVKRLIGDAVFPLNQLRFVRAASPADFWGCIRLWGSGGLFGYYGRFWSKALGQTTWYVTDRNRMLILDGGGKRIVVSPDNPDEFLASIQPAAGLPPAEHPDPSAVNAPLAILLAVGVISVGLVIAATTYDPGRPPVDITANSLVIHSRFYGMTLPAASVDVPNIRVIDLQNEPQWKPVARTNGFGNKHYRAGNFRTAGGQQVKLFTTGSPRLLLLPPADPNGTTVLLDAADPAQFAQRLRNEWKTR